MKAILNLINPITFIVTAYNIIKELIEYRTYSQVIIRMQEEEILERNGFKRGPLYSIVKGVNLRAETEMYPEEEREGFELGFVAAEMKKYNELLMKEGILNMVTTETERVHTQDYHGYTVNIWYDFKHTKFTSILYCSIYSITLSIIAFSIDYKYLADSFMKIFNI